VSRGPKAHPWRTLTEAALAYAAANTETEFRRAGWRLAAAARRFRDEPSPVGRPRGEAAGEGAGR
jgi:hypothetical protein